MKNKEAISTSSSSSSFSLLPQAINELVDILNHLQNVVYSGRNLSSDEKKTWTETVREIKANGYVVKKKTHTFMGRKVGVSWRAVPAQEATKKSRNFSAEWKIVDMRPKDGKPTCKGDCTTRAMAYCLQEIASYREIEEEQYRLAEESNREKGLRWGDGRAKVHRNSQGLWDKIMVDLGYSWVRFSRTVRRDNLACFLRKASDSRPIISHSSGHVAVIDGGSVVDSWDSRHGRCDRILVYGNDLSKVKAILEENGVKFM